MAVVSDERFNRAKSTYIDNAQKEFTQFHKSDRQRKKSSFTVKTSRSILHSWSFYLIILCLAMQLGQTQPKELQLLLCKYLRYIEECNNTVSESSKNLSLNETYCPGGFDGFICWPHGSADSVVRHPCPNYMEYENGTSFAHRFCLGNGSWHRVMTEEGLMIWDYRDDCRPVNEFKLNEESEEAKQEMAMLNGLGITYTVGYVISLVCLIIALILFTYFRKLHCMRNYIHMNLMISFILRYTTVLIKDQVIKAHYDPKQFEEFNEEELKLYCDDFGGVSGYMISCRLVISLMHYAILANYFWLLAEGIYLQILLSFPMTKENKYFPFFMAGGWGAPWIPVGIWVVLRITLENIGCWEMYENPYIWWCLRIPVIASIAINFIIFINIIRIIITKLRAHNLKRNDYKMTLAKSTLALIPLLGIHYIVFLAITDDMVDSLNLVMKVKIGFEMVLTSIQGMLIAVFYCFLNGEVRGEVVKFWKNIRLKNGLPSNTYRKTSTYNSNGTQLTAMMYTTSEEKTQVLQETCLLNPSIRCDSNKSSRTSTMTNHEPKVHQPEGSDCSLVGINVNSGSIPSMRKDSV